MVLTLIRSLLSLKKVVGIISIVALSAGGIFAWKYLVQKEAEKVIVAHENARLSEVVKRQEEDRILVEEIRKEQKRINDEISQKWDDVRRRIDAIQDEESVEWRNTLVPERIAGELFKSGLPD